MTKPNRHIKNQIVLLSRRTLNNEALILPSMKGDLMLEIAYIIVSKAKQFGLQILTLQVNPRGYEMIVFDRDARRSDFLKAVNQLISLAVKKRIQHDESLWTTTKPVYQTILDLSSLKKEIVKCCTFAVRNGFVRRQRDWEMPQIGPADWGKTQTFRKSNGMEVELSAGPGELVSILTDVDTLKKQLCAEVEVVERREKSRRQTILGMKGCYEKSRFENWKYKSEKRVLAFLSDSVARLSSANARMRKFCKEHRQALVDYLDRKSVKFPVGTLKMRTLFRQECGPSDAEDPHAFCL